MASAFTGTHCANTFIDGHRTVITTKDKISKDEDINSRHRRTATV